MYLGEVGDMVARTAPRVRDWLIAAPLVPINGRRRAHLRQVHVRRVPTPPPLGLRERSWRERMTPDDARLQAHHDAVAAAAARTLYSHDPLVPSLARAIATALPGELLHLNRVVVNPGHHGAPLTDLDVETLHAVIQVKSGRAGNIGHQMTVSESISDKVVLGFAPHADAEEVAALRRCGHEVFTDLGALLERLAELAARGRRPLAA